MKNLNLILVSFAIAAQSFAFPMFCNGINSKASVNENGSRAQIYDRKNNSVVFGRLRCTTIFTRELRPEGRPVVSCQTFQSDDKAGLKLYVYRPHGTRIYVGKLKSLSNLEPKVIDTLNCVMSDQ